MAKIDLPDDDVSVNPNATLFWRVMFVVVGLLAVVMVIFAVLHLNRHALCLQVNSLCLYDFPLTSTD